ncbi:MAG TPA: twin-arginine translocase subunit TatC [Saprospiraceae bacterium]|nr:twin-arginine translocase subunit TatC [Saprospiraceae bacterium]
MAQPLKNPNEMSFFEHIEVLRWHLFRSALAVVIISIGMFSAKTFIFQYVILGPLSPGFPTYRFFCSFGPSFCFFPAKLNIITRDIQEQFMCHIKVSLWLGFIVSFPYIFYEFWKFIKPGLYKKEIKAARGMVFICSFLFLFGVAFGYFLISPVAVTFLASYSVSPDVVNTTTLDSFVDNMTMFTLPMGLIFELPVVIYFLAKIGIVSSPMLAQYRRHAVVVITILSAIITPTTDIFTMTLVGLPLYALYEISIIVTKKVDQERAAKDLIDDTENG